MATMMPARVLPCRCRPGELLGISASRATPVASSSAHPGQAGEVHEDDCQQSNASSHGENGARAPEGGGRTHGDGDEAGHASESGDCGHRDEAASDHPVFPLVGHLVGHCFLLDDVSLCGAAPLPRTRRLGPGMPETPLREFSPRPSGRGCRESRRPPGQRGCAAAPRSGSPPGMTPGWEPEPAPA